MSLSVRDLIHRREGVDLEAKAAQGRDGQGELPQSFWETYSAFANTYGGQIILGLKEDREGDLQAVGIGNPESVIKALWDNLNNRKQVSSNLLTEADVEIAVLDDKRVIVVNVPRAKRSERPVFLGTNPFSGTFRRHHEGDYKCDKNVVRQLIADGPISRTASC